MPAISIVFKKTLVVIGTNSLVYVVLNYCLRAKLRVSLMVLDVFIKIDTASQAKDSQNDHHQC
ncbi:MAG: hypothetical protein ACJAZ0_000359 [Halioglobus sp.]|jgi:hypothetical protein